ncbi:MAG: hypothetical protein ACLPT4_00120, partial [Verrucomicrobiia bacterium]
LQSACDAVDSAQVVWRRGSVEREQALQRLGSVNGNEFFSATIDWKGSAEYIFHVHACGQPRWWR